MLWDSHVHTTFSGDGKASPEEQLDRAVALGLPGLTFTDHTDYDFPPVSENKKFNPDYFKFDSSEYWAKLPVLKEANRERMKLLIGVELGMQLSSIDKNRAFLAENEYDFVIGSIHVVDRMDPYFGSYWERFSSPEDGIRRYFTVMLENLEAFSDFDSLGHLDYIARYVKDPGFSYNCSDYLDLIKEILSFLIRHGKALELNTGGFRSPLGDSNPTEALVALYHDMGGRLITVGSDAHYTKHLGLCFDRAERILKSSGFKEYMVFKGRDPVTLPL